MRVMYILLNHSLTKEQEESASKKWDIGCFKYLSKELSIIWNSISPEGELEIEKLDPIICWLDTAQNNDLVLVQGEFGATFYIVDYCFNRKIIPIYSTSKRDYSEIKMPDGSIKRKHIFKHVEFRKYKRWFNK